MIVITSGMIRKTSGMMSGNAGMIVRTSGMKSKAAQFTPKTLILWAFSLKLLLASKA
jgi:hypothetical protein